MAYDSHTFLAGLATQGQGLRRRKKSPVLRILGLAAIVAALGWGAYALLPGASTFMTGFFHKEETVQPAQDALLPDGGDIPSAPQPTVRKTAPVPTAPAVATQPVRPAAPELESTRLPGTGVSSAIASPTPDPTKTPATPGAATQPGAVTTPTASPTTTRTTAAPDRSGLVGRDGKPLSELARDWLEVERLEREKDTTGLYRQLEKILTAHPKDAHGANALYRLGVLSYQQGKLPEAYGYWQRAMQDTPSHQGGELAALVMADIWWKEQGVDKPGANPADWEKIRDAYAIALGRGPAPHLTAETRERIVERLNFLNKTIIFSPFECRNSIVHEVQPREVLAYIARRYEVHHDSIAIINHIEAPRYSLRQGQKLKVLRMTSDKTEVFVDKRSLKLTLFLDGLWIKEYDICVGPGTKTPLGTFSVLDKVVNPDWTDPATHQTFPFGHPNNILGTRWMRLTNDGIGIHGTSKPETIPGRESNGCIRMHNADVEELYGFVLRLSKVTIVE